MDGDRPTEAAAAVDGAGPVPMEPTSTEPPPPTPGGPPPAPDPAPAADPPVNLPVPAAAHPPVFPAPPGAVPPPHPPYGPPGPFPPPPYGTHPGAFPPQPQAFPVPPPRRGFRYPPLLPRTHRWGLGAYFVVELVFLATSLLVDRLVRAAGPATAGTLAVSLAVPTVVAAGVAILFTRLRGNGPRIDFGIAWSWRDVGIGLACGLGGMLISLPFSIVYVSLVGSDLNSAVGEVFGHVRAAPLVAVGVLLIVVLLAPLCEEIVYRGLLWGGVERLGANRWLTLAVTTIVFALAHFEFERTPVLLVVALPIGLARVFTGKLLPSVVAHQVNNLLPGIGLMLGLLGVVPMA